MSYCLRSVDLFHEQLLTDCFMYFSFENLQICNFVSKRLNTSKEIAWQISKTSDRFLQFNKFYAIFEPFLNVFGALFNNFWANFEPFLTVIVLFLPLSSFHPNLSYAEDRQRKCLTYRFTDALLSVYSASVTVFLRLCNPITTHL